MNLHSCHAEDLQARIEHLEEQLEASRLALKALGRQEVQDDSDLVTDQISDKVAISSKQWPLMQAEYSRYGRQIILPEFGLSGHRTLKNASVLVVGAGGLGCPAATYLARAGIGKMGIIDGDQVDISNLHRQTLYGVADVGHSKVLSAIKSLRASNPEVQYVVHEFHIDPSNAIDVISLYDLILDCTDHPSSRYLISDAAVLTGKPLVSASALRLDGQLMVLNNPPTPVGTLNGGPCYRCIFPKPPPPEAVLTCGEGGILGPIVGVMGVLQAVEALRIILSSAGAQSFNGKAEDFSSHREQRKHKMLLYSGFSEQPFRTIQLRGRKPGCAMCSSTSSISKETLTSGSFDYARFCGSLAPTNVLTPDERMSAKDLAPSVHSSAKDSKATILDVREKPHFELCKLENSVNIPWSELEPLTTLSDVYKACPTLNSSSSLAIVCKFGNDSQHAVKKLKNLAADEGGGKDVRDVIGGLEAWRREVDPTWPAY